MFYGDSILTSDMIPTCCLVASDCSESHTRKRSQTSRAWRSYSAKASSQLGMKSASYPWTFPAPICEIRFIALKWAGDALYAIMCFFDSQTVSVFWYPPREPKSQSNTPSAFRAFLDAGAVMMKNRNHPNKPLGFSPVTETYMSYSNSAVEMMDETHDGSSAYIVRFDLINPIDLPSSGHIDHLVYECVTCTNSIKEPHFLKDHIAIRFLP